MRTARRPYRVHPHKTTLRPGIDAAGFNRLADEIEDEAVVEKAARNLTTAVQPAAHAIEHSGEIPSTGSAG